ncbi:hemolymph lipopolysaccharide-binding protein-like isoform X1 [Ooceraea biroi]|uniref:hemolymph lipopolysaccharide-binding protein-like isoform X1 n=1 Tax=Ooceraea biroi TaxID=2015173 RepID=UPI0005BC5659|nr:hemolymph lipopolysaccharide-binding protein-like isoform X1 [Ooceraea biroi]
MFEYFVLAFAFWCQIHEYVFAKTNTIYKGNLPTQIAPSEIPVLLNTSEHNCSENAGQLNNVPANGHNNYHVGQLIFYVYGEQQLKRLLPDNNLNIKPDNKHTEKLKKNDYLITPGIGAHKLHSRKVTWNKARQACIQEGGHLAIINSALEEMILIHMLQDKNVTAGWLGLHDFYEEGDWVTILDESLESTGYTRWTTKWPNEPNNAGGDQNCATLITWGGMADIKCDLSYSFFCEISI